MVHLMTARKNRTGYDRDREYLTSNQLTGFRNALGTLAHLMETGDPKNYFNLESGFDNCRYLEIFRPAAHLLEEKLFEDLSRRLIDQGRSEEHTSELQSRGHLVCRLLLEKKNTKIYDPVMLENHIQMIA